MRRVVLLLATMAATALLAAGVALTQTPDGEGAGRYIVVLDDAADPGQISSEMARRHGLGVGFVYSNALKGFSAMIPSERVAAIRADERVAYVEPDATMYAQVLPWGIDRIDADTSSTKAGNGRGSVSNVNVYIIDSGIDRDHVDLNVVNHVNFAGGRNADCNGHGTHVAGTVAAKDNDRGVVGVAPGAPLIGVKVLDCTGFGSRSRIIEGIDWVTANAKKPAVANMSIGGEASRSIDDAVERSAESGVFYSLSAGNYGADACNYSPARTGGGTDNGIATVAATDRSDEERSSSNYGPCVDIWAPGESIRSTKRGGGTTIKSGTSMAAPHVGGGAALYLSINTTSTPVEVEDALTSSATTTTNPSKDGTSAVLREYVGGF